MRWHYLLYIIDAILAPANISATPVDSIVFDGLHISEFAFINSTTVVCPTNFDDTSRQFYFTKVKDFNKTVNGIMAIKSNDPFEGYKKSYNRSSTQDGVAFWTRPNDFNFLVSKGSQFKSYKLILPKNMMMDSFFYNDSLLMKGGSNALNNFFYQHNRIQITAMGSVFRCGDIQYFSFIKGLSSGSNDSYLYNLKSGGIYCSGKITPDSTCGHLPIIGVAPVAADSSYIYAVVPAYQLFQSKDENKDKNPVYSPAMENYFTTQNRKSSSVIAILKPKYNL